MTPRAEFETPKGRFINPIFAPQKTFYHQRSNAESTFSMIKRKFSDIVRAKMTFP